MRIGAIADVTVKLECIIARCASGNGDPAGRELCVLGQRSEGDWQAGVARDDVQFCLAIGRTGMPMPLRSSRNDSTVWNRRAVSPVSLAAFTF